MIRLFMPLALLVLTLIAFARPAEYDEGYSLFITAGDPRPAWPTGIFTPAVAQAALTGTASPAAIVTALRTTDVHPPLYFWALAAWRRLVGPNWFAARLLSVGCALGSLALVGWLARLTARPPAAAMTLTLLSYGFAYTGTIARDIAPAVLLDLAGLALILVAARPPHPDPPPQGGREILTSPSPLWGGPGWGAVQRPGLTAFAAGLAFGAASFTNYLAIFMGLTTLTWAIARGHQRLAAAAAAGICLFLPADYAMYAAQAGSRGGQFAPFSTAALPRLARDAGAAWFGGLPLYAGAAAPLVAALLAFLLLGAGLSARRHRAGAAWLLIAATAATPAGLLALGLIFHNTPIEIRYLAFSLPPAALLLSTAAPAWRGTLVAVQAAAIAGLALAPQTMQPQQRAARDATAFTDNPLILLPYGNDGVGIPAQFMQGAPTNARLFLLRGAMPDLSAEPHILLATIAIDARSTAETAMAKAAFAADRCYRATAPTALITSVLNACAHQQPHGGGKLTAIDDHRELVATGEGGHLPGIAQPVEIRDQPEPQPQRH
jgi:hypothetical protein